MKTKKEGRAEMKETWAAVPGDHFKDALDLIDDVEEATALLRKSQSYLWGADDSRAQHRANATFLEEPSQGATT